MSVGRDEFLRARPCWLCVIQEFHPRARYECCTSADDLSQLAALANRSLILYESETCLLALILRQSSRRLDVGIKVLSSDRLDVYRSDLVVVQVLWEMNF